MAHRRRRPVTSDEVVRAWIDFFGSKGHRLIPSSSLVPEDPTVLLTTAGMQQFIPYMLGRARPPHRRLMSVQKCFRTTDLENVGNPRTLTFFEMLGNFSIGDYFKKEAIDLAWDFVFHWLQIPMERVWVTVHPTDHEALHHWLEKGFPQERVHQLEDNWWGPPGAEGPCGPDSEIYYDQGPAVGCQRPTCAPGCDCDRFLEFWNLVFMQFYQDREGNRTPLVQKNIDTGMGLERVSTILQGKSSVYDTDLFMPLIAGIEKLVGKRYGTDEKTDFAIRVLADHARAMTFLVNDGVTPGPEKQGYVLRRVIRRAVLYGRNLGVDRLFTGGLVDLVVDRMTDRYPELRTNQAAIRQVVEREEQGFSQTLEAGLGRLETWIDEVKSRGQAVVPGELVFRLYDTYGFPREISAEVIRNAGLEVDWEGFDRAMEAQRARSRATARFREAAERTIEAAALPPTEFLGYETMEADGTVLALRDEAGAYVDALTEGARGTVVLDHTPFYAEAGGQVGDTGVLEGPNGTFRVEDTQWDEGDRILHIGRVVSGTVKSGDVVTARVDQVRRRDIMRHHTVTHIMHRALKDVLGEQTMQRGSLVNEEFTRFDYNALAPPSREQLDRVVQIINERLLQDLPVVTQIVPMQEAVRMGAVRIFEEKYGEIVRVVKVGDYSMELCGGTHVRRSGEIGSALLMREEGIGGGLRRIYLVAGRRAVEFARRRLQELDELAEKVGAPVEAVPEKVSSLMEEVDRLKKENARLSTVLAARQAEDLLKSAARRVDGVTVIAARVEGQTKDSMREMVDYIRGRLDGGVVVLGTVDRERGTPVFIASVSPQLIGPEFNAIKLVRRVAQVTRGGGGGREDLAEGGGRDPSKLDEALGKVTSIVEEALGKR